MDKLANIHDTDHDPDTVCIRKEKLPLYEAAASSLHGPHSFSRIRPSWQSFAVIFPNRETWTSEG